MEALPGWLSNYLASHSAEYLPHPTTFLNQRRWEDELSKSPVLAVYEAHTRAPGQNATRKPSGYQPPPENGIPETPELWAALNEASAAQREANRRAAADAS